MVYACTSLKKNHSSHYKINFLKGFHVYKLVCYISSFRLYHGRVRQGALHCLLAVVKGVEKRTLYGYWSSFIPDSPIGGPPPLTLLTIILKDPSPKVRHTVTLVPLLLDMHGCNICVFSLPSRCVRVLFRCCRPCWTAPVSSWPSPKTRRLLVRLTPLSPSCWPRPSESCTALSVWLCWLRPPLRPSLRS